MPQSKIKVPELMRKAASAEKSGDLDTAFEIFEEILSHFPKNPKAKAGHARLSEIVVPARSVRQAFDEQLQAQLSNQVAGRNLSGVEDPLGISEQETRARRNENPFAHLETISGVVDPLKAQAYCEQASTFLIAKDYWQAALHFLTAVELDASRGEIWYDLGNSLFLSGHAQAGCIAQKRAIALDDCPMQAYTILAESLSVLGRHTEAADVLKSSMERFPEDSEATVALADLRISSGELSEGLSLLRSAIRSDLKNADAWFRLSDSPDLKFNGEEHNLLEKELNSGSFNGTARGTALLALGNILARAQRFDDAFACYEEGNSILKLDRPYDIEDTRSVFEQIKSLFSNGHIEKLLLPEITISSATPLFVLGMPRSGSTLIEQILTSHSSVSGAGESSALGGVLYSQLSNRSKDDLLDKDLLRGVRDEYFKRTKMLAGDAAFLTDKDLRNFRYIGYIFHAFPEAKVIHMRRNPMAVCWSIFTKNFAGTGFNYSFDLKSLGEYHKLYEDMMAFWRELFPDRIIEVDYEAFTRDAESGTRELLKKCGLPFEQATMEFHKNRRAARTSSMSQVRKKVYQGSSDQWRNYEKHLTELKEILERT